MARGETDRAGRSRAPRHGASHSRGQSHRYARSRGRGAEVARTILLMLVALVVGFGAALIAYPHIPFPTLGETPAAAGRTTVSQDELDLRLGSYSYSGQTVSVSVREAIEESMSLDAAKNADGSYSVPSADNVLALARNRLLVADAQARGLSVSDEEVAAYAQATYGTADYAAIAVGYQMTAEQAAAHMKDAALLKKLRDTVVSTAQPTAPQAPTAPEDGAQDDPRPEYAAYLLALVGDEWDAAANTWAREDGPYRAVLSSYTISNDGATYSAAQAAFEVAQRLYADAEQQIATEWTAYVNEILAQVTIEICSLVA